MIGIVSDDDLLKELANLNGSDISVANPTEIAGAATPSEDATIDNSADAVGLATNIPEPDNPNEIVWGTTEEKGPGVVVDIQRGRGHTREVPESLRKLVASSALDGASPADIAKHLGVSPSSTSAYKVGANSTSTYHKPDPSLLDHVVTKRGKITDKATAKLLLALKNISPELVGGAKLKELSGLAKDMSTVMRNMDQSANNPLLGGNKGPTYIFYAPRIKKEDDFEVVNAVEEF